MAAIRRSAQAQDLSLNVLLAVPALLVYELGLALLGSRVQNGADLLLGELFRLLGRPGVVALNACLTAAAVVGVLDASARHQRLGQRFLLLGLECLVYALALGPFVLLLERGLPRLGTSGAGGLGQAVVVALGAGLYEELLFRLLLVAALRTLLSEFGGLRPALATPLALALAAALFALAHHDVLLAGGEPFALRPFLFRTLAGFLLGVVYWLRGLAAAVYTHAFYDLLVFLG